MPPESCLQASTCNFVIKETLAQVFSCEFCEISKNSFSIEHLRTTASGSSPFKLVAACGNNIENISPKNIFVESLLDLLQNVKQHDMFTRNPYRHLSLKILIKTFSSVRYKLKNTGRHEMSYDVKFIKLCNF